MNSASTQYCAEGVRTGCRMLGKLDLVGWAEKLGGKKHLPSFYIRLLQQFEKPFATVSENRNLRAAALMKIRKIGRSRRRFELARSIISDALKKRCTNIAISALDLGNNVANFASGRTES